jgi:hypothetical protein
MTGDRISPNTASDGVGTDPVANRKGNRRKFDRGAENELVKATGGTERGRWMETNRQAFADYDEFVDLYGVFSLGKRLF